MKNSYLEWLKVQKYADNTQTAQMHRIKKVEEFYGCLDEHYSNNTLKNVIADLQYSTADERSNKPNPSKLVFDGNIRKNLQSYKDAVIRYNKFLNDNDFDKSYIQSSHIEESNEIEEISETINQKLSLERDMQIALRNNIKTLNPDLKIIDDGAERSVNSGLIDITCEDQNCIVVIELKAGKADGRSIGQILGYMGDLQEEDDTKPVRGILIANDFDKRVKSASKVISNLELKKYSIEFSFEDEI